MEPTYSREYERNKGHQGRSGKRSGGKVTDSITYLSSPINLKISLPSSLIHKLPEIYYPFHQIDDTQSPTDPSPPLFSISCLFLLLQKITFLTQNVLIAGKFSEAEKP